MATASSTSPAATAKAIVIATGFAHTCAIISGGGVKCWGDNSTGLLGNGSTRDSSVPVDVSGLVSGVTAIAAGYAHTCAVSRGGVECWGLNSYGQLGDGSTTNSNIPVHVSGVASGVKEIAAGTGWVCALALAGGLTCWGLNDGGQLGNGSTTNSGTPVAVSGMASGVTAVAAGGFHNCALTTAGGVKCWGYNHWGQLGNGSTGGDTGTPAPVDVAGLTNGVRAIAAGALYACALMTVGAVKCWGQNDSGQLGNGTTTDSDIPVDVASATSGIIAIAAGGSHTCALTGAGAVSCWGKNDSGQLGDGTTTSSATPVDVSGLTSGVVAIAAGDSQTCALLGTGAVKCWGLNSKGQLGNGATVNSTTPVDVEGL